MEQIVCYCREVVRKALWSLLVGVAAALPAVHGVRERPVAPTEAPARPSPVVEQAKKTEADTLVLVRPDAYVAAQLAHATPARVEAALRATLSFDGAEPQRATETA